MLFSTLLFYIFSSILIISALAVVSSKNTIYGVMFLILAFVNAAGLFILLGAEFFGILLIIVYVGAIAILFLFVVMMLNVDEVKKKVKIPFPFALIFSIILAIEMYVISVVSDITSANLRKIISLPIEANVSNTEAIGNVLYTKYFYPFQLAGAVLFVAMIGAIVLTIKENERLIRKQSISNQVNRKREDSVEVVQVQSGKGIDI